MRPIVTRQPQSAKSTQTTAGVIAPGCGYGAASATLKAVRSAKLRVHANGIGFEAENAESIFAPFKPLHSAKQYHGSGIGLATCERIVERFGGRIDADSQPGRGSKFWFTIPEERITEELVARQESQSGK